MASIHAQEGVDVEVFVIRDRPNKEAHDELYGTFMERATGFDFFAKVDADMVLESPTLLRRVADRFAELPEVEMITIRLHDYFLMDLIYGMHCFRSSVRWDPRHDELFTDHDRDRPRHVMLEVGESGVELSHCRNPNPFQAFHFGLHRGVKFRQALDGPEEFRSQAQWHYVNVEAIGTQFLKTQDQRRGFAAIGAELGVSGRFTWEDIPYTNRKTGEYFEKEVRPLSSTDLRKRYLSLRNSNRRPLSRVSLYGWHRRLMRTRLRGVYQRILRLARIELP